MAEAMVRDLHGYGRRRPLVAWPGAARVAVSFVLNYEEGGERNVLDGDAHAENYLVPRSWGCRRSPGAAASSRTSSIRQPRRFLARAAAVRGAWTAFHLLGSRGRR